MIHNVLMTALTPLKNKNEINNWENQPFTTVWPENIQQKTRDITITIKKKKKRVRTAFSTEQLRTLERTYCRNRYIDSKKRAELARALNIGDKCVKIWFQNRRMKEKKESSESSCDSSSESVGNDTSTVPASPPLQITLDQLAIDQQLNQYLYYNNSEHTYQLPPYFNTNHIQPGHEGMQAPDFSTYFYNDNNIHPTQYYPLDVNYSNGEGNHFNQYSPEINNCWSANHYPYYTM